MIVLTGADLVLPDRVLPGGTLVIDHGRIAELRPDSQVSHASSFAFHGHTIVPGFVDAHVHGVLGVDTLDAGDAVSRIASALPRYGVTAFCPTTVACGADDLARVLGQVRACRQHQPSRAARVLPAHLESSFINPEYAGAQPHAHIRTPAGAPDLLAIIDAYAAEIAIVTMAPEVADGLDLVAWLTARGIRVSLGHSGASCEVGLAAIEAGAVQATHLFNRMPPLHHRDPGLAGAVLQSPDVVAELICDGVHVHPAMVRLTVAAKTPARVMAVSDATAVAGLAPGGTGALGGRCITAAARHAVLDDGTMAGSILTMDAAFRNLTGPMGFSLVDAATLCATTPARQLGLAGQGHIVEGGSADLVVLDRAHEVVQTYVDGRLVYARGVQDGNSARIASV
ncbi:MAG: N-acetylglucosamine-6-phosphate deacetylase [Vicinamibacterales bacterium]